MNGFLSGLSIAPDGQVWVISATGTPYRYDPPGHRWQTPFGQVARDANDLQADTGALWASTTSNGLLRFDLSTHRYAAIYFSGRRQEDAEESLLDLHQDTTHPDWLWIGGYQGLILYNKRTGRYQRFTTANGLPNNTVYTILPDRQGYLWLSTNRGLCRFHPVTHTTRTIGLSDGLAGDEFNRFHHLKLPDGRLAFGGVEGWVLFDPARIRPDTAKPVVAITGLKINNQPTDTSGKPTPLPQLFNTLTALRLTHDQNYLTVDFVALGSHRRSECRQLLGLVNELLDLTRLEAGKLTLHPQTVRLSMLLRDCLTPFAEQAQQLGIALTLEQTGDDTAVVIDAGKLNRVIQILLANACKFTPPGGSILLRATAHDTLVRIGVIDTGRGIHPEDLPHVFDRYFQTQQPDAPLEGGTGIGLALCQELVRLIEGTLTVHSKPGRGSSFLVDIPFARPTGDDTDVDELPVFDGILPVREIPKPDQRALAAQETVLIMEDNDDLRTYLTTVLSPSLRVLTAANGRAALDRLADVEPPPALIISDIMMPVMDGFQLLETLKSHPTYRTIPVVMLTVRTDAADKLRALRLGVDDYLLKPFDEAELTARVTVLLHNQRERQAPDTTEPTTDLPEETETPPIVSADEQTWLAHLEQLTAGAPGAVRPDRR